MKGLENNYRIAKEEKQALFSDEELKGIKELLAVKEQLLLVAITPLNEQAINILDIDRTNSKKATFNMDIDLLNELGKYNNNLNIIKSDIVNIAVKEYLEHHNKAMTKVKKKLQEDIIESEGE